MQARSGFRLQESNGPGKENRLIPDRPVLYLRFRRSIDRPDKSICLIGGVFPGNPQQRFRTDRLYGVDHLRQPDTVRQSSFVAVPADTDHPDAAHLHPGPQKREIPRLKEGTRAGEKHNFSVDLSNSGPVVRLYREGQATGLPEDRCRRPQRHPPVRLLRCFRNACGVN